MVVCFARLPPVHTLLATAKKERHVIFVCILSSNCFFVILRYDSFIALEVSASEYSWTVPSTLASRSDYHIQVVDSTDFSLEGRSPRVVISSSFPPTLSPTTDTPTFVPTPIPTPSPTLTFVPTSLPTPVPTSSPTFAPTESSLLVLEPHAQSAWAFGETRAIVWRFSGTLAGTTTGRVTLKLYLDGALEVRPSLSRLGIRLASFERVPPPPSLTTAHATRDDDRRAAGRGDNVVRLDPPERARVGRRVLDARAGTNVNFWCTPVKYTRLY
jgi:hypothetical protein